MPIRVPTGRPREAQRAYDHARANRIARRWYRTERWARLRRRILVDAAYACASCGQVQLALEVDHVVPHRGDAARFWDAANLQALCSSCHGEKTRAGR